METINAVYLEIDGQNMTQFIKAINLLKTNGIEFNIIEPTQNNSSTPVEETNTFFENAIDYKKAFGKKGIEVLNLLSVGATYNEIASELDIPIDTVRYYVKKIFKTLEVSNGRDAVRIYLTQIKPQM